MERKQGFPRSDKSSDIADALYNKAKKLGVNFLQGRAVKLILEDGELTGVKTENGCKPIGLLSQPAACLAANRLCDGYKLAKRPVIQSCR